MIEQVSRREIKVELVRLAITYEQAVGLPAQRVKRKDTRARKYISKFGDRCWEIEVLPPERLLQIVEEALQRRIPVEFLRESELRQEASKVAAELLRSLREQIEAKAYELLQRGVPSEEVERRLKRIFEFP